ncbi:MULTISPECIES: aspartate aminotransferase family protein [Thiorhodovibrio]|uniref:aspartate aminotransferase family protein n=1 Tax=Thiorhodovibrio TaxID=61593 RepID=UPI0019112FD8|nr:MULTISPECIES: aspartate aminotransferase family protein [Thiorhodovibrio]MBK5969611.1 hypothetical protein [Thiorhodovibrio winogradskyi]WPL14678.1 4-aminobutyrate aminotransferase GabT [Thiorhodovibrio litoralis]
MAVSELSHYESIRDAYACPCDESKMYDRFVNPVKAEGMWVWFDGDPEPYLDLVLNYCSVNFGHCYPPIVKIVQEAVNEVDQIHSFHSKDKLELSEILARKVGRDQRSYKVYFNIGGSAAVSDAVRLCRFGSGKRYMIAFEGAFHGVSEAAASLADEKLVAKEQYGVPISDFTLSVPFPSQHNDVSVDESLATIERLFSTHDVAGVIVEPIQGAGGFVIPKESFLPGLSQLCKKHGVNLVMDEIQVGFGRAGSLFVYEQYGVEYPDVVLLSKSIGGGFFPVSAVIARAELFDNVPSRGTAFQTTFNNSSFGLRVANRLMQYVEKEKIFDDVLERGALFLKKLEFLNAKQCVKNLRGVGFAVAFDVVDPKSGQPSERLAKKLMSICMDEHVIVYACGVNFNSIKIIPPIVIDEADMDLIAMRLQSCFDRFCDCAH